MLLSLAYEFYVKGPTNTNHLTLADCANADHEAAIKALLKGLAARIASKPGFYIHTSGNMLFSYPDLDRKTYGEASTKTYNDWEGISEVTLLPDHAPHRVADRIIINADGPELKTAIVCPPIIYGQGRGPDNQRSQQVPEMARCTLERKRGFQIGAGMNSMSNVHIYDLSDCYLRLVEAAIEGGRNVTWGREGYYFTENGEYTWGHVAQGIATAAHRQGLIPSDEVAPISEMEADGMSSWGSARWGTNSRYRAVRARKLLGWAPKEMSLDHYIPEAVSIEAKRLGLVPGHAAKVAG